MITEAILNVLLAPFTWFMDLIPALDGLEIPDGIFITITDLLSCIGYVLPIQGLLPILIFLIAMSLVKIVWALVIRIKSFIPTMGS